MCKPVRIISRNEIKPVAREKKKKKEKKSRLLDLKTLIIDIQDKPVS